MSLHADCREGHAARTRTTRNALGLSVEARLPDLQWLRPLAVQETGAGLPQPRRGALEARYAPDTPAARRRRRAPRGLSRRTRGRAPRTTPRHPARRGAVGRGQRVATLTPQGVRRCLRLNAPARTPRLRARQRVPRPRAACERRTGGTEIL